MAEIGRWLALTIGTSMVCAGFVACGGSTVEPPINDIGSARGPIGGSSAGDSGADAVSAAAACTGANAGCNDLALCGPKNFVTNAALATPAPTGGAIAPGVYSMTSFTVYTGTNGTTGKTGNWFMETFQVLPVPSGDGGVDAGATLDAAIDAGVEDAGPVATTYPWLDVTASDQQGQTNLSGSLVTAGTSLEYEFDCPNTTSSPASYSATATTLTIFLPGEPGGTGGLVYTLMQ
jgi:hypothetical protein